MESSYVELELLLENKKYVVGIVTKEYPHFNADFVDLTSLGKKYNIPYMYAQNINGTEVKEFI